MPIQKGNTQNLVCTKTMSNVQAFAGACDATNNPRKEMNHAGEGFGGWRVVFLDAGGEGGEEEKRAQLKCG